MADAKQFGNPKVLQFGDKTAGNQSGDSGHCAQCEAMLADALDGTLSAADQTLFDAHMAQCGPCAQLLADARRGAAWLEMLRTPAPEPPASLLERILAQTSGAQAPIPVGMPQALTTPQQGVPALAPGYTTSGTAPAYGTVIPFYRRAATALRANSFGHIVFQPRLAMTAAMAFFSVALTMNLTGVHLQDLHASDLKPSNLTRAYHLTNARVARYYENLRVVYELESRVRDLQAATDNDPTGGSQRTVPAPSQKPQASPDEPGTTAPANQPGKSGPANDSPDDGSPSNQPGQKQNPPAAKPAPNGGTSRREGPGRPRNGLAPLFAELDSTISDIKNMNSNGNNKNVEGSLV